MPIWAKTMAVAFAEAGTDVLDEADEAVATAAAAVVIAVPLAVLAALPTEAVPEAAVAAFVLVADAVSMLSVDWPKYLLTKFGDRRCADEAPGNVTSAFSVVHVILFAAKADNKA